MAFRPVPTKDLKKFLKSLGLQYKRTQGSYEIWDYPDDSLDRPVVFRGNKKEVPSFHIQTIFNTLKLDQKDFKNYFG